MSDPVDSHPVSSQNEVKIEMKKKQFYSILKRKQTQNIHVIAKSLNYTKKNNHSFCCYSPIQNNRLQFCMQLIVHTHSQNSKNMMQNIIQSAIRYSIATYFDGDNNNDVIYLAISSSFLACT